ncbi:MAG TPA: hypothetical protein VJZ76_02645 [Thermoanaerobaculia bacterium]|nr:hypothetical protein [Thermoanaerobaculia bacterium]
MKVTRTGSAAFTAELESDDELRAEHAANLAFGALALPTEESVARDTTLLVTLRGAGGGEMHVKATVVAALPGKLALQIDADPDELLKRLLTAEEKPSSVNAWDRVRGLSQMEKLLLAVKADRSERAILAQDNDPRVLLSLLRNPRLTVDEVVRVAKSSFLTFQIADVIMKASQWSGNLDVRVALIHNPKTPPAFQMRILPTLPEGEIRNIARGGTNMALKTAALRLLQGR